MAVHEQRVRALSSARIPAGTHKKLSLTDDATDSLEALVGGTEDLAKQFEGYEEHETLSYVLAEYRETVGCLQALATWNDYQNDCVEALYEDISESAGSRLQIAAQDIPSMGRARMAEELQKWDYIISDTAFLSDITGVSDLHIEEVRPPLGALVRTAERLDHRFSGPSSPTYSTITSRHSTCNLGPM
jgi:hypothetical protein